MIKFLDKQAKTFWGKTFNIFFGLVLMLIVGIGMTKYVYPWLYAEAQFFFSPVYVRPFLISIFECVILAPLIEEYLFRHFPITYCKVLSKRLIVPVIFFSSIIFGLVHYGAPSVPVQGVCGFIMACVYVKNGYSYWSTVTMHALYNLIIILI